LGGIRGCRKCKGGGLCFVRRNCTKIVQREGSFRERCLLSRAHIDGTADTDRKMRPLPRLRVRERGFARASASGDQGNHERQRDSKPFPRALFWCNGVKRANHKFSSLRMAFTQSNRIFGRMPNADRASAKCGLILSKMFLKARNASFAKSPENGNKSGEIGGN
jgi:hypothetical protein